MLKSMLLGLFLCGTSLPLLAQKGELELSAYGAWQAYQKRDKAYAPTSLQVGEWGCK